MTLVVVGRYGRMGNRVWAYANALAFALEHHVPIVNTAFTPWSGLFAGNSNSRDRGKSPRRSDSLAAKRWRNTRNVGYDIGYRINLRTRTFPSIELGDSNLLDLDAEAAWIVAQRIVFLSGFYLAAPNSLEKQEPAVRRFFLPTESIRDPADELIDSLRANADVLIGVHVRHGDYRTYCNGIMFYSNGEYADVMRCLVDQFPGRRVAFLVCSDESYEPSVFGGLSVQMGPGSAVGDMYALARCDYLFGPNSSFSHWASFWGEVPLHVLDWKAAQIYGAAVPVKQPLIERDFHVFTARQFGSHSERRVRINETLR